MITAGAFNGKTYGVYGLARSGRAAVASLVASGANVLAWDDGEAARAAFGGPLTDLHAHSLAGLDGLVVSPGVPHEVPLVQKAMAEHVPVIGDIELFALARAALPAHKVVGITGTNGKSTTSALIHHVLASAGFPVTMGVEMIVGTVRRRAPEEPSSASSPSHHVPLRFDALSRRPRSRTDTYAPCCGRSRPRPRGSGRHSVQNRRVSVPRSVVVRAPRSVSVSAFSDRSNVSRL